MAACPAATALHAAQDFPSPDPSFNSKDSGFSQNWLKVAQEEIQKREYRITRQGQPNQPASEHDYQSPNRRQAFRVFYTQDGIRLEPRMRRSATSAQWEWGLRLRAYGYPRNMQALAQGSRLASGNRMTFDRPALTEWYINDPDGLEQGFTLKAPPPGIPDSEIQLQMEVTGTMRGQVLQDAILFRDQSGDGLVRYGKLNAFDAKGRFLPTRFVLHHKMLSIFVRVEGAHYPIIIDPLVTRPGPSLSGEQVASGYGFAVATAGDVNRDGYSDVVIGAPQYDRGQDDEGAAFVYLGGPDGLLPRAQWIGEGDQSHAAYGFSVATAGDVNRDGYSDVVIGAPQYDRGEENEGAAFVYLGGPDGLLSRAQWIGEGDQSDAGYGFSVATASDVNGDGYSDVVIGANLYEQGQADEGAAFVYLGSPNGLAAQPHWTGEGNQVEAAYGASVATAGDVNHDGYSDVVIGASLYDQGQTNEGAAFIYLGSAAGLSSLPYWTGEGNQAEAGYGISVGTAGDVNGDGYSDVIVGAYLYQNLQPEEGRAFVYHGAEDAIEGRAAWILDGGQFRSHFGFSVATAGDVNGDGYADVIVGAPLYDNGEENEGRIRLFLGTADGLETTSVLTVEGNVRFAQYGVSVSTAGDINGDGYADAFIGANLFENTVAEEGGAFLHLGGASGPELAASWIVEGEQTDSNFGVSVTSAGDVNGDGYADVLVGASLYDKGQLDEGVVFLYLGSAQGLRPEPDWMAEGNQVASGFGGVVASAGDVNGDGYGDVLVGASLYDNGEIDEGLVFLYLGGVSGLSADADWTAESNQAASAFGGAVASAGDVNGDGYADIIIGAEAFDFLEVDEGRVFVYLGAARGPSRRADWTAEGNQAASGFGGAVASVGDVNGDGYADIAVGAGLYDHEQLDEGGVFVYLGSALGPSVAPDWTKSGGQEGSGFGRALSSAGDVNGDGYTELLVGARFFDQDHAQEGRTFLYYGTQAGLRSTSAWTKSGGQFGAEFGASVASAGDINGDGYADVIVGSVLYNKTRADEGAAFLFLGGSAGLPDTPDWEAFGRQLDARFGGSVAGAGDVNGDGYADLVVSAPLFDNGKSNEGGLFLYYGNRSRGLSLKPQQVRHDNTGLIAPFAYSDRSNALRLSALARSPFGGTPMKLEWEIKPFGRAFDGLNMGESDTWTDASVSGQTINVPITGLLPKKHYHWRLRLHYDPSASPYQQRSRWFSMPENALQVADFRTRTGFLIAPAEGESALPTTITFVWEQISLPDGRAADYQFCLKVGDGPFQENQDCSELIDGVNAKNTGVQTFVWAELGLWGVALFFFGRTVRENVEARTRTQWSILFSCFVVLIFSSCHSGGGGGGQNSGPGPISPMTEIRHTVSDLRPGTHYRWKVLVRDTQRIVDRSEVRTFFTE